MPTNRTSYYYALDLVVAIEEHLRRGTHHFRRAETGRLLTTLDEVVRAILDDDLAPPAGIGFWVETEHGPLHILGDPELARDENFLTALDAMARAAAKEDSDA